MKRSLRVALPFIIVINSSAAYAGGSVPESEILALSDTWIQAEVSHDKGTLERVLDKRFLATLISGKTIDKNGYIKWITSTKIDPFEVVDKVINVHGDSALVIGVIKDDPLKVTWVAVRMAGVWRAISLTFSNIAAPN
jgi:hypothetical protein